MRDLRRYLPPRGRQQLARVLREHKGERLEDVMVQLAKRQPKRNIMHERVRQLLTGRCAHEAPISTADRTRHKSQIVRNFEVTSRTAHGLVDVSASPTKSDAMSVRAGQSDDVARIAKTNFDNACSYLFANLGRQFLNPTDLQFFVELLATKVNRWIVEPTRFMRAEDSTKYPYTLKADLEDAYNSFFSELYLMLDDPRVDPRVLAAWIEYRVDLTDHYFSDGCGKIAKLLSAWSLMRRGEDLPSYVSRENYYDPDAKPSTRREPGEADFESPQFHRWLRKYEGFFSS
jgi:hypothetical protein